MTSFVGNWSFSSLMSYETCPMRFRLAKIDRLPEPPRPPDNPLERGNRVHKRLEKFINGTGPIDTEARAIKKFEAPLKHLRDLYAEGKATAEDDWFFDYDWGVCDRDAVWLWSKLDFNVMDVENNTSIIGDYKTGGSIYKAVEHAQQMQLYAAATALRQEWAHRIIVELWYVDEGHIKRQEYTHEEALRYVGRFQQRADRIYADKTFRPNPTKQTCKWCPYSPRGTGACPVGV